MKLQKLVEPQLPVGVRVNELITDNDKAYAFIVDEELDVIECSFTYSNDVTIHTKEFNQIILSTETLLKVASLISKSEKYFQKHFKNK